MDESILNIFAASIIRYFTTTTDQPAVMGTPFLGHEDEKVALDFSAVIGISGTYRGNIYYTAPRSKLHALLPVLGEHELTDHLCGELVGEITNTISGNAREELGGGFMISTPFLLSGTNDSVRPAHGAPCFILPIEWKSHSSRVLVTLVKTDSPNTP
ncbi:MAG: chemotaxis protein CheX [Luteolibacter sp.]